MTKLSLVPRALSDPPPHHRSCPLYLLPPFSLVDRFIRGRIRTGIEYPGRRKVEAGGGGWTRRTVRGGQISGRGHDDERSRRRRRKNFVSINNSGPVLAARESTHHLPLSVRQDSSFLLPLLRFSFLHPPCRLVRFFGEAVKEGRLEGGSKNLIFS